MNAILKIEKIFKPDVVGPLRYNLPNVMPMQGWRCNDDSIKTDVGIYIK